MKVAVFSSKPYDMRFLEPMAERFGYVLHFLEPRLNQVTAPLAQGHEAVCVFVNDDLSAGVLRKLADQGTKIVALRCAGFNNVDLNAADELGVRVVRVPAYSPHAVAEHTVALLLTLNRKVHRAYNRVREGNFALEGLLGFDVFGKTFGVVGTGKIGQEVVKIMKGFGCPVLMYDPFPDPAVEKLGGKFVSLEELFSQSDIISLHCPLTPETKHIINSHSLALMKNGVVILNTSRGALIKTRSIIEGLKSGKIGYLALDVYEEEGDLFFEDFSNQVIQDDVFMRLLTFPNVLVTGHQAYFTSNALINIAETTLNNIKQVANGEACPNEVILSKIKKV